MTVFKISAENNISLLDSTQQAGENSGETFSTLQELGALAERWPGSRLIEIWNSLPGVEPVRRFTSRQVAITRIWNAIQHLQTSDGAEKKAPAPKKAHTNKAARAVRPTAGGNTKAAKVIALMRKPNGATLHALMRATGWQTHSVRGFISGHLKKKLGLKVRSSKRDGERVYSLKP